METIRRALLLGLAAPVSIGLMAQGPYALVVHGEVPNCAPGTTVILETGPGTLPPQSVTAVLGPGCMYEATITVESETGTITAHTPCGNGTAATGSGSYAIGGPLGDELVIDLSCGGAGGPCSACFSLGPVIDINGEAIPFAVLGVDCTDTIMGAYTYQVDWGDGVTNTAGDHVYGAAGAYEACLTIGTAWGCTSTACDSVWVDADGWVTSQPVWYDCNGALWGPAVPGSPCDDGDSATVQDQLDASCGCAGIPCVPLPDPLTLNLGPVTAACSMESILQGVLDVLEQGMYPMHYAWTGPGVAVTDTMPWIQLFEPGSYHLALSNACSTSEADFTVSIVPAPDAGISAMVTVCSTSNPFLMLGALGGTPDAGGTWTGPDGQLAPPIFDPATMPPGVYVYTVAGTAPCPNASAMLTVMIDDNQIWYADADGDGLGDPNESVTACEQPAGYVGNADDACPNLHGTVGWPCDDGDPFTVGDAIAPDCSCAGTSVVVDCLGVPGGTALPGTACILDNGGPQYPGVWTLDCACDTSSTGPGGCQAGFWVLQGMAADSLDPAISMPIPYELWVWNLSSGAEPVQYGWDFGDGTTSTDPYPVHVYGSSGPYNLCLALSDAAGCTSLYCDSVSIDGDGYYDGMAPTSGELRSGFTIRVLPELATGILAAPAIAGLRLWPNPAGEEIHIAFMSRVAGSLSVEVTDATGRTVILEERQLHAGSQALRLGTERIEPGLYTVRIGLGAHSEALRFIKAR